MEMKDRFETRRQQECKIQSGRERIEFRQQLKAQRALDQDPQENIQQFERKFADTIRTITEDLSNLTTDSPVTQAIESLFSRVHLLGQDLNSSLHFLTTYTIMHCQSSINSLLENIHQKQVELAPRPKFKFSNRRTGKKASNQPTVQEISRFQVALEGLVDLMDTQVKKYDEQLNNFNCYQLKNLENCQIILAGRLKAIHILNAKNCKIYVGPVAGAAHITNCEDCVINIACHQLRIHQSNRCQFYVWVSSLPIVEHVSEVGFAPYGFQYEGIEEHFETSELRGENKWDQVQDFRWLKKEASPFWRILEKSERLETKTASQFFHQKISQT